MLTNSSTLSDQGMFVSAETMLNQSTVPHLEKIHKEIVNDMKCQRHEIHPMYPADFASQLDVLSLKDMKTAIHQLLDLRDQIYGCYLGRYQFIHVLMTRMTKRYFNVYVIHLTLQCAMIRMAETD